MSTESSESRIITEDADWMLPTTPIMLDDKGSKIREICVIRDNPRFRQVILLLLQQLQFLRGLNRIRCIPIDQSHFQKQLYQCQDLLSWQ